MNMAVMKCGVVNFLWAGQFHMIMSGKIIPKVGESPTTWSFDSTLELSRHLWVYHLACRLMIKVQLNLACLSSWTHLILISLCYAPGVFHSFESCALPPSILFHALFMSTGPTVLALQSCGRTTRKQLVFPLGGKYWIISSPSTVTGLHLPCVYNMCNNSISQ